MSLISCTPKNDDSNIGKYNEEELIQKATLELHKLEDIKNLKFDFNNVSIKKFNKKDFDLKESNWIVDPNETLIDSIDFVITIGNPHIESKTEENFIHWFYISNEDEFVMYSVFNSHTHEIPFTIVKE